MRQTNYQYTRATRSRAAKIGWRTRRLDGAKRCPHCDTLHTDLLGHVYRHHPRGIGDLWHGLRRLWRS